MVARATRSHQMALLRIQVFERDGGRCRACEDLLTWESAHLHHIVYRSQMGLDEAFNLILLCADCHQDEHLHRIHITGTADTLAIARD